MRSCHRTAYRIWYTIAHMKQAMNWFWGVLGLLIIVGIGVSWYAGRVETPSNLGGFAQCLKDKGAIFYGAFWCPHCQNTKKLFGSAAEALPYIECSTPDGRGQLQVCKDAKIDSYPTWVFADASRLLGEVPLSQLAEKTSCTLPQ